MLRVALATQNYLQPNNGQAVFTRRLAEGLARRGHAVCVVTPAEDAPQAGRGGAVEVRCVPSLAMPFFRDVHVSLFADGAVAGVLDDFRPDVVHVQDPFPLCVSVARQARRRGLPLVATNHFMPENIVPFVPVLSRWGWTRRALESLLTAWTVHVFRQADVRCAPTATAARMLEDGLGAVLPVSNGVDLEAFRPEDVDPAVARRRYGIDVTRPAFFFIGRVDREKRLDVLIRALPGVPDAQLVIAGTGRDREAWIRLAARLGVARRVVFPGFVPEADVRVLMNSVDVFAMPSDAELQSIATLEAMACARPVLASDAGALPELVSEGVNGALFRHGDPHDAACAMRRLLVWRDRWPRLGQASLQRARGHDVARTVTRYEDIYRTAASEVLPRAWRSPRLRPVRGLAP